MIIILHDVLHPNLRISGSIHIYVYIFTFLAVLIYVSIYIYIYMYMYVGSCRIHVLNSSSHQQPGLIVI